MERRTKYQYTYFIHPFIIQKEKYENYILKLMKDKRCELKIFTKEKDLNLYTYFMPKIREYLFWSISYNQNQIKKFNELDIKLKTRMLSQKQCIMFDYKIGEYIQGKVGEKNGIFFDIPKIEIICFKTGECFLLIKTILSDESQMNEILNFNYKFRDINSNYSKLQEYENIKIQTNRFQYVKDVQQIVKEITGDNNLTKKINVENERFLTYTYVCLDQEYWNENKGFEEVASDFAKLKNVLPAKTQMNLNMNLEQSITLSTLQYVKIGITKQAIALLASSINTVNYTKIPHIFENEYLYTYIFALYQKVFLEKIKCEFKENSFSKVEKNFEQFTENVWNEDITLNVDGSILYKEIYKNYDIEKNYQSAKGRYEIANKKNNSRRIRDISYILLVLFIIIIAKIIFF